MRDMPRCHMPLIRHEFGAKIRSNMSMYFAKPWSVYTDVLGGLFTYLLFWTLVFGLVHVY